MPTTAQFLLPVLALIAWTLVMWFWLYATRLPAMKRAGIDPQEAAHPGTYAQRMPEHARSVADNYNHLHEQPTIFYALMFFIALSGGIAASTLGLASCIRWCRRPSTASSCASRCSRSDRCCWFA
jgi:hypothetical protein